MSDAKPVPREAAPAVSIVLPLFNEAAVLATLISEVSSALAGRSETVELLFVNDGSTDDSARVLDAIAGARPDVRVLHFSRNFGHQAALQAGLLHASGAAVIVMDSDLQDDPRAIPRFLEKWREGYEVVYAVRVGRKEGWLKRSLFFAFYRVLNAISSTPMPMDAGNFCLLDAKVAKEIAGLLDRDRYFPGLRRWVGFRQTGIAVERGARYDNKPRVSVMGLWRLAKTAVFSFSAFPLSIFYAFAGVSMLVFLGLGGFTLYHKLFTGLAIPGWTSITLTACFFGAINALGIAILGEYVSRIYEQVRSRPLFVIARHVNLSENLPSSECRESGRDSCESAS